MTQKLRQMWQKKQLQSRGMTNLFHVRALLYRLDIKTVKAPFTQPVHSFVRMPSETK